VSEWGQPLSFSKKIIKLCIRLINEGLHKKSHNLTEPNWQIPAAADLVVINSPGNGYPPALIKKCWEQNVPYVLLSQSVSESEWVADDVLEQCRSTYQNALAAYFVSHANLASTACQLAYQGNHFRVISNPYKVDRAKPYQPATRKACPQLAFVGRLEPEHKGLDLLFLALSRPSWQNREYHLNLYGTGRSARQVAEMAAFLGISHRLTFHGQVESIEKVWEENEILLLPSRHEGLPLAVIEAMMCGRPCLVTDVSGNPEHVEAGRTGFIAAGATANAVAIALEEAWSQRDQWETMGRAAYEAIRFAIPADPVTVFADQLESFA
jgi:glycosyltransferase involved in cell wall biosynthesis